MQYLGQEHFRNKEQVQRFSAGSNPERSACRKGESGCGEIWELLEGIWHFLRVGQMWWYTPIIPVTGEAGGWRIESLKPAWATYRGTLSQRQRERKRESGRQTDWAG
jgi:hypothetical protein